MILPFNHMGGTMRVHIFGDTGGQLPALQSGLMTAGMKQHTLPSDTMILHLGDLVHRGPYSSLAVSFVDKIMQVNPGQWIQIMGNHEAMHLGHLSFFKCNCDAEAIETLQKWYSEGALVPAAALTNVAPRKWTNGNRPLHQEEAVSDILAVHGGLTWNFWRDKLRSPESASETARAINELSQRVLFKSGIVLDGWPANHRAGPVWAAAAEEVYPSWEGVTPPFSQAVGHTTPFSFWTNSWRRGLPKRFRKSAKGVPAEKRAVAFFEEAEALLMMDPGFGKEREEFQPFLTVEAAEAKF